MEVLRRGTSGPDGRERHNGTGKSRVCRPPERHRREGSRAQRDPDVGVAFSLVSFSWPSKSYEAKRSNSPRLARRVSEANQETRPERAKSESSASAENGQAPAKEANPTSQ